MDKEINWGSQKSPSSLSKVVAESRFIARELPMLNFLIFSKNRACQLDLLLRNIRFLTLINPSLYNINVLYTHDEDHKSSYEVCQHEHIKRVNFIKEVDFVSQVKELLYDSICLLTDDTSFFRKFNLPFVVPENECFSWRLGYNTVVQDHFNQTFQPLLIPDSYSDNLISWNPNNYPNWCNWGYPFSFDGHVYSSKTLLDILKDKDFKNTNEIEGILHSQRDKIKKITSNIHSSCVNIPCNNLSGLTGFGSKYEYSMSFLKNKFDQGFRIKPIQESKVPIMACHQEFEFSFYNKE
jgi:hypothetical protein